MMASSRAQCFARGEVLACDGTSSSSNVDSKVPELFWPLAVAVAVSGLAIASGVISATSHWLIYPAITAMLVGGLPHGACDIALAMTSFKRTRREIVPPIGAYIGVGAMMVALWSLSPVAALLVFLGLSGFHFGEDWAMLPSGLLRAMAGFSVITMAAFGQQDAVAQLFAALTGSPDAVMVARWVKAAAPVCFLVTLISVHLAWRSGHRRWVTACCTCLLGLLLLPPIVGFTLFFVGLHGPRHWQSVQRMMRPKQLLNAGRESVSLTVLTLALWLIWMWFAREPSGLESSAEAFRLLSIVAAPHLALSLAIERRLDLANLCHKALNKTAPRISAPLLPRR